MDRLFREHGPEAVNGGGDVSRVDFHCVTDSVDLLASHEGGSGSGKEVDNDLPGSTGVGYRVCH